MKKLLKNFDYKPLIMSFSLIIVQTIFYFFAKLLQGDAHLIGNFIDKKIPFSNIFIIPYSIWYILLFLVPYFYYKKDKEIFIKYTTCYFICAFISTIIFIIYPTTVIRPEIQNDSLLNIITNIVYWVDSPALNCFPSLHCAISMLFILTVFNLKDTKIIYKISLIAMSILIMIATLYTKQHVFIDLVSGDMLMIIVYFIFSNNKVINNKVKKLLKI